jgi:voltage-gated sodium channel
MVIGIVVNVMERENEKARAEKEAALLEEQIAQGHVEPTLHDILKELRELRAQVAAQGNKEYVNKAD